MTKNIFRATVWIVSVVCLLGASNGAPPVESFRQAVKPRVWSFPKDHGRHDGYKLEWWYFTGNLHDSAGRKFGYQLTFFRSAFTAVAATRPSGFAMNDLYFAHAAISDIEAKSFAFRDRLERGRAGLAAASDQCLNVSLLDWSAKQDGGKMHLLADEKQLAIDLTCGEGRGPFLEGPGGVNRKGREPEQASYYYSMTRLKTAGTIAVNGKRFVVEGLSWMDHEFSSNALAKNQVGWDWMGLQLNDGTDLMIYRLRDSTGRADYLSGTRVTPDGIAHYLTDSEIVIAGADPWKSERSGAAYPQRWSVAVAGMGPLVVQSDMPGQELVTSGTTKVTYFEGATTVTDGSGKPAGSGYLEMTGYAPEGPK